MSDIKISMSTPRRRKIIGLRFSELSLGEMVTNAKLPIQNEED
jgi:hypothetical protein